ncbi:MAG: hypothetical protein V3T40_00090 [Nitrososphaerales archaeon]
MIPLQLETRTRLQKKIPGVEAKIDIVFERKEDPTFDQIEVRLMAQMFNTKRNEIESEQNH